MLEEILKNINSNLERIAKALETENIEVDAEMVHGAAEQFRQPVMAPQTVAVQTPQKPIQTQIPQMSQTPVVQPAMPVQSIPTASVQESFTQEQLAVAMSNAVSAGKRDVIQGILQQLGVQALTQINPTDYNRVAAMLMEAGVKV